MVAIGWVGRRNLGLGVREFWAVKKIGIHDVEQR